MFKDYFTSAIRNLSRNKGYSFIVILCLTVGLTACLLVATVVINDLSYDRQWKQSKNIYRILSVDTTGKGVEVMPVAYLGLGPTLKRQFSEVNDYCRMRIISPDFRMGKSMDAVKLPCLQADTSVWNFLNFKIITGNPLHIVHGYINMVLSESVAKQYFLNTNPVGKIIEDVSPIGLTRKFLITGVIKEMPSNTCLYAKALLFSEPNSTDNGLSGNGSTYFTQQFILLKPGINIHAFTQKMNRWYIPLIRENNLDSYNFEFQPISQIHLYPKIGGDSDNSGSMHNVYIFSAVALLLLLIACINFVNLSAISMMKRVKESGIRKVLGADKRQLVMQFLTESVLFFLISFGLSMIFYSIFLHGVEKFIGHPIGLSLINHSGLIIICGGVVLLVSLLTGLYPAWLLSKPKAITVVRGNLFEGTNTAELRKVLITAQFVLAIILIIIMIITRDQLYFLNHKDLGYNKENLLRLGFTDWKNNGDAFKEQVKNIPGVKSVSITSWTPGEGGGGNMGYSANDPLDTTRRIEISAITGDIDFAETLGVHLEKGRLLSHRLAKDVVNFDSVSKALFTPSEVITEYTAQRFGIKSLNTYNRSLRGIPVGIIKNFNNESLFNKIKPTIIMASSDNRYGFMLVRVEPESGSQVLKRINKLWEQFYPNYLLQDDWVSDILAKQYESEKKFGRLFTLFSSLSIFLACLGLFGLIAFITERRTKEIGIRKVLGASVQSIVALLSKEFIRLVLIAFVIASPIAWWIMNKWLQNFAYKIHISWWIFLVAGVVAVLLALITVSFQAIKAAIANPVGSLRSE